MYTRYIVVFAPKKNGVPDPNTDRLQLFFIIILLFGNLTIGSSRDFSIGKPGG